MADPKNKPQDNPANEEAGGEKPAPAASTTLKDWIAPILGLLLMVGFVWFMIYMIGQIGLEELKWTRLVYLLTGIEAVAFAAAGYFFGGEAGRKQAETAQQNADEANEENQAAQEDNAELAANQRAMHTMIKTKAQRLRKTGSGRLSGNAQPATGAQDWDELEQMAEALLKRK